jgi:hypothetical protein
MIRVTGEHEIEGCARSRASGRTGLRLDDKYNTPELFTAVGRATATRLEGQIAIGAQPRISSGPLGA